MRGTLSIAAGMLQGGDIGLISRNRIACLTPLVTSALVLIFGAACNLKGERRGIPAEVEAVIGTVSADISSGRYDKIYNEASDLWQQELTLEESTATFKTLNTRLGNVESRALHSATEQHNSGGPLKGEAFIIRYQTRFEKGDGMETFTLVKRDARWQLARYLVNSTALK